jgi:hypothetical protein
MFLLVMKVCDLAVIHGPFCDSHIGTGIGIGYTKQPAGNGNGSSTGSCVGDTGNGPFGDTYFSFNGNGSGSFTGSCDGDNSNAPLGDSYIGTGIGIGYTQQLTGNGNSPSIGPWYGGNGNGPFGDTYIGTVIGIGTGIGISSDIPPNGNRLPYVRPSHRDRCIPSPVHPSQSLSAPSISTSCPRHVHLPSYGLRARAPPAGMLLRAPPAGMLLLRSYGPRARAPPAGMLLRAPPAGMLLLRTLFLPWPVHPSQSLRARRILLGDHVPSGRYYLSNVLIDAQPHISDSNSNAFVGSWSNANSSLTSARHTDSIDAQSRHFDANLSNTFTPPAMSNAVIDALPHISDLSNAFARHTYYYYIFRAGAHTVTPPAKFNVIANTFDSHTHSDVQAHVCDSTSPTTDPPWRPCTQWSLLPDGSSLATMYPVAVIT